MCITDWAQSAFDMGESLTMLRSACNANDTDGCIYAGNRVRRIVLVFLDSLNIQSIPGNERDAVYEVQRHCILVDSLLRKPLLDRDAVLAELMEAIGRLYYLLEMTLPIETITVIELLCPIAEDKPWATTMRQSSSFNENVTK